METIVFEIKGAYGHFRKIYAPLSPVTYSFPPPPTVMGMIGGICGYGKEEYLEKIGWQDVRLAISLKNPVSKYRTGLNLINTKSNTFFRLKGESPRIQIPYEFLKHPHYRIFVSGAKKEAMETLKLFLKKGKTVFTPSLGLAQCIAEVDFIDVLDAEKLTEEEHLISSVVPREQIKHAYYKPGGRYNRFRVAHRMRPLGRVVEKYTEAEVEEGAKSITVHTDKAYSVGGENVLFF